MRHPALGLALLLLVASPAGAALAADTAEKPVADVTFRCDQGKTIGAVFYADRVDLTLSDGRSLTLPQAMSASGARYANADESIVFWNKGDTAFITEGADGPETYSGCVVAD